MSEYDKPHSFNVYDYNPATRPEQGPDYTGYPAHQAQAGAYVAPQSQVPSGLPQSAAAFNSTPPTQYYGAPDPTYYPPQHVPYAEYVDAGPGPRPLPEIISYAPVQGRAGTKLVVSLRSNFDLELPPIIPVIMFGQKRCPGLLSKPVPSGQGFQYSLTANAPPLSPTATPSPQVPLSLTFEDSSVAWQEPSTDFGTFTYVDQPNFYPLNPPAQLDSKKRKLSEEASPRRSPTKKPSLHSLSGAVSAVPRATPTSPFRKPSVSGANSQNRRFSGPDFHQPYNPGLRHVQSQHFYTSSQTPPPLPPTQSPSWSHTTNAQSINRSPQSVATPATSKTSILPSPASNPPLIRTSTLHQSPTTPGTVSAPPQSFNPYTFYPANAKAVLKLEGDLSTMTQKWTNEEWDAGRRLVQFRRSQQGSVISATFEPVTLEDRIPNSICVSCIWWAEKEECYVTSVDTISLLESLVAVRFTVEEKNRIRRNLEGFRPMTVTKAKADSDEFFKLIMGFPNPKPRNIEKDVKVFPWRILATALKKIIGKYSASYSSTAGALHTPGTAGPNYPPSRTSDSSVEPPQRPAASPLSTSSSTTTSHAYVSNIPNPYPAHAATSAAGMGITPGIAPSAGPPDLRLAVPVSAPGHAPPWSQPLSHYSTDPSVSRAAGPWEMGAYLHPLPAVGMPQPSPAISLPNITRPLYYAQDAPPIPGQLAMPSVARFVPLHNYEDQNHQTSNA